MSIARPKFLKTLATAARRKPSTVADDHMLTG